MTHKHFIIIFLDFSCYRDYVIVALPQLKCLDGREITRTDRLMAQKNFDNNRREIIQLQVQHQMSRDEQKIRVKCQIDAMENLDLDDEEKSRQ